MFTVIFSGAVTFQWGARRETLSLLGHFKNVQFIVKISMRLPLTEEYLSKRKEICSMVTCIV
jgi:hypothetical protein